ncbi:NADP-dependent oxidoreductase domain-containing protein [Xylariaceae sp. FL1651]|nr:NADP-dependent oxidoreductase domain-containing protein [Xylariaceae sp. FL1651]
MRKPALPSSNSRSSLLEVSSRSLRDLDLDTRDTKFDGYYLHAPDPQTPMQESYAAIQELYQAGVFKRFGLSNISSAEVRRFHDHGKANGYVLPTLFQGYYNAVARRCEDELLPVLRELGISFYCYSPLGAGFFTSTAEDIKRGAGRFDLRDVDGVVYQNMYSKPSYLAALQQWKDLANRTGVGAAALAFRWINFHSRLNAEHGDGIITSADTPEQLQELMLWRREGALEEDIVAEMDKIWEVCKGEAALDCVSGWMEDVTNGRVEIPDCMKQYST